MQSKERVHFKHAFVLLTSPAAAPPGRRLGVGISNGGLGYYCNHKIQTQHPGVLCDYTHTKLGGPTPSGLRVVMTGVSDGHRDTRRVAFEGREQMSEIRVMS